MAELKQWVNLTTADKWVGEELDERDRMGPRSHLKIQFEPRHRATAWVTVEADAKNADYSKREKRKRKNFRARTYTKKRFSTNTKGLMVLKIDVTLAGNPGGKHAFGPGEPPVAVSRQSAATDNFLSQVRKIPALIGMGDPPHGHGAAATLSRVIKPNGISRIATATRRFNRPLICWRSPLR